MSNLFVFLLGLIPPTDMVSADTMDLEEVAVYAAPLKKYTFGQWVETLDEADLKASVGKDLGEVLQQKTGLFVRQYGPGMLASLTMRGTSSGHNALYWNGLPVNSPSLGQADFSIFPMGSFDEVAIHHGSAGALYGTDAIGGAIHLSNKLRFNNSTELGINTLLGSFGRWHQMVKYGFSDEQFAARTKVYRNFSQNNFPYRDLTISGTPERRQEHAQVEQWGLMQDFAINLDEKQLLTSAIWLNQTEREIQPVIGSNVKDRQSDQNFRWVADYFRFEKSITWNLKAGLVLDDLDFNLEQNRTLQYLLQADMDAALNEQWQTKAGIRFTHIDGILSTYQQQEQRTEMYYASNFQPNENLGISLQLRQLIYGGNWAPFTPSIGGTWTFFTHPKHGLVINTNFSRGFKVPTLNDRFWVPGGNPDLNPENSWSGEAGISHELNDGPIVVNSRLTYYKMWVDHWIIWLPQQGYWRPENIRNVENSGLEFHLDANLEKGEWESTATLNHTWTRALNKSGDRGNDRSIGKQLPYTPEHKTQMTLSSGKGAYQGHFSIVRVGERFIATDNSGVLDAYQVFDLGLRRALSIGKKIQGNVGFQINNIFDADYQVIRLRPMPGRNYQLNIQLTL